MARPMSRRSRRSRSMFSRAHMLPSLEPVTPPMLGALKRRRANRRSAGWVVALGVSGLVHAGLVVGLLVYGRSGSTVASPRAPSPGWAVLELPPLTAPVEVASAASPDL